VAKSEKIIYLGLDPGLNITGYGLISECDRVVRLIEAGTITSSHQASLPERLVELYDGLSELIKAYKPGVMGVEEIFSHYKHPATAIIMAHARGVICLAAAHEDIRVVTLPATLIKRLLTGNGRASKFQVKGMVKHLLGLKQPKISDDVSDALAVALALREQERYAGKG
jgi:crossover junction endodeoxyribonuclease RuvC